ncbi:MAG: histidine phosphatase family protein [Chloroflexi bacterium]|nr:MAG: histidine phosphatase family protein [Chloroflexota bacterium]
MTTLHLLRHAKSSWADEELSDHDRPLAPRGRRAATAMAELLRERGVAPELVLCSSARRARETLDLVGPALAPGARVLVEDGLYGASAEELLERLRRVPAPTASVMLVGHNPSMQDLALALAAPGAETERLRAKFPTGALATLRIPAGGWADLRRRGAELVDLVLPREL